MHVLADWVVCCSCINGARERRRKYIYTREEKEEEGRSPDLSHYNNLFVWFCFVVTRERENCAPFLCLIRRIIYGAY